MSIIYQIIINSIIAGSLYSLIALGFNLIYSTTRFFNLAHGALVAVGGYTFFYFAEKLGLGIIPSLVIGVIVSGLFGYFFDKFVFNKLRQKKASSTSSLVASLGIMTVIQAILAMIFSSRFQILGSGYDFKLYQFLGSTITTPQIMIFFSVIVVTFGLIFILKFTRFGKEIRAVSDNEQVAKVIGINTDRVTAKVFFLGSAIAGLSGILVGFDTGIEPTMGFSLLLKGVIASIIGTVGNVYGGIFGAFLLAFIENFAVWKISGEWKDAVAFTILIIFLIIRPNGLLKK